MKLYTWRVTYNKFTYVATARTNVGAIFQAWRIARISGLKYRLKDMMDLSEVECIRVI